MNVRQLRTGIILAMALAAGGCGIFGHKKPSTPVLGERIAVLATESDVSVDPATAALPMSLPAPVVNPAWSQSGGNASKAMGHVALGASIAQAWEASIGQGTSLSARLAAAPIVADGRVYTIDTLATVRAFDAQTGAPLWRTQFVGVLRRWRRKKRLETSAIVIVLLWRIPRSLFRHDDDKLRDTFSSRW